MKDFNTYLDYLVNRLALKHSATIIDDVVYYDRPVTAVRRNNLLKDGQKYPGLTKPDKQIHNLGFWYLWKDIEILTYNEWKKLA